MKLLSIQFVILLTISLTLAKKKFIIDGTLQKLRQDYREFKTTKKLELDKSFFDIYNAIDVELVKLQHPFDKINKLWNRTCSKFPFAVLDDDTESKLKDLCKNGDNLLQNSLKIRQKGLNTFFSGDLTTPTPPLNFFEDFCDEIETQVEEVWSFYLQRNSSCVGMMIDSFLQFFDPTVNDVISLGKTTKENVTNEFKNSEIVVGIAIENVEKMINQINLCVSVKDINLCIWKMVKIAKYFD